MDTGIGAEGNPTNPAKIRQRRPGGNGPRFVKAKNRYETGPMVGRRSGSKEKLIRLIDVKRIFTNFRVKFIKNNHNLGSSQFTIEFLTGNPFP